VSGDNVTLNANRHFSTLGIKCPSGFDFSFFQGIVKPVCPVFSEVATWIWAFSLPFLKSAEELQNAPGCI